MMLLPLVWIRSRALLLTKVMRRRRSTMMIISGIDWNICCENRIWFFRLISAFLRLLMSAIDRQEVAELAVDVPDQREGEGDVDLVPAFQHHGGFLVDDMVVVAQFRRRSRG